MVPGTRSSLLKIHATRPVPDIQVTGLFAKNKTLGLGNMDGHHTDHDPCPQIFVHETREHKSTRLAVEIPTPVVNATRKCGI